MTDAPVVLVTGASQGIGREIALAFAATGGRLVLTARNRPKLEETARLVADQGADALVLCADVADAEDVERMAAEALTEMGRINVSAGLVTY